MVSRNTERFKNKYGFYSYSRVINMDLDIQGGGGIINLASRDTYEFMKHGDFIHSRCLTYKKYKAL